MSWPQVAALLALVAACDTTTPRPDAGAPRPDADGACCACTVGGSEIDCTAAQDAACAAESTPGECWCVNDSVVAAC